MDHSVSGKSNEGALRRIGAHINDRAPENDSVRNCHTLAAQLLGRQERSRMDPLRTRESESTRKVDRQSGDKHELLLLSTRSAMERGAGRFFTPAQSKD